MGKRENEYSSLQTLTNTNWQRKLIFLTVYLCVQRQTVHPIQFLFPIEISSLIQLNIVFSSPAFSPICIDFHTSNNLHFSQQWDT